MVFWSADVRVSKFVWEKCNFHNDDEEQVKAKNLGPWLRTNYIQKVVNNFFKLSKIDPKM